MDKLHYRDEAVKSMVNRCNIYLTLRQIQVTKGKALIEAMCKTELEDIGFFAQSILDEYCTEG